MAFIYACFLFIFYSGLVCNGSDTMLPGQTLFSNQTLVSKGGRFELGFFSPGNSSSYYVGIWYKNIPARTVVWVLNREEPIPDSSYNNSRLQFFSNGRLLLYNDQWLSYWEGYSLEIAEVVVLDTGNFVLRNASGGILWQSFDSPTDTWLPGMKLPRLVTYSFPGESPIFIDGVYSWMNPNDPAFGNYSFRMLSRELYIRFKESKILWMSGALQGGTFASLSDYSTFSTSYNFTYFSSDYDDDYIEYNVYNESLTLRIVLDYEGRLTHFGWSESRQKWTVLSCSSHPTCRPNTICNANSSPACRCLDGFIPRVQQDWDVSDFSYGCERMRPLECVEDRTRFTKVTTATLPANSESRKVTYDACYLVCSSNCSCTAYAYDTARGCLLFMRDLMGLESPPNNSVGVDLFIKTESTNTTAAAAAHKLLPVALVVPITAAVLISCLCFCYLYVWPKLKNKRSSVTYQNLLRLEIDSKGPANVRHASDSQEKDSRNELPIFSFSSIAASTNNFSITNKLGQGGFGPVYKGELLNGQFVAVKRLSRRSGQGLEEFKNEMELIARLQHRNLVGILGCCNENDEMILVYEYMPNKSLDHFLFEQTKKELLDWKRRVHIISGIAQGLLYLHHYSRFRIVHRDLKASNILLDAEMNPKISDFGMARIFGGNDLQANTKRIVGTYGYMSPEYAMDGLFSVKSDVFAFGVLMLEIISGKKNIGCYGSDSLSLLRYAWNIWKQDSAHELIDPTLEIHDSPSTSILALRYIQIALLCVEENPADRPAMYDVVGMLDNEKRALASPQNPAFTVGRNLPKTPTQHKVEICSVNGLTLSNVEAR